MVNKNNKLQLLFCTIALIFLLQNKLLAETGVELKKAFSIEEFKKVKNANPNNQLCKDTVISDQELIYESVEILPSFNGDYYKFLKKNLRYPADATKKRIQGRVILNFIIEKDGSLSNFKIVRGIGGGCDEEAIRVFKNSPKWSPGVQNGKTVRVNYTVPIFFQLK